MEFVEVTCPSCFEVCEIAAPSPDEVPAVLDYDCEICCRPMEIDVKEVNGMVVGEARGLGE
jgi:hypothetical protein